MSLTHYRTRAQYNAWMNDKVYAAAAPLLESPRKENCAPLMAYSLREAALHPVSLSDWTGLLY
jgi:uncharacterized damage-inducible protein DinB